MAACPNCGTDNQPGASFCVRCGTQLDRVVSAAGVLPPPPAPPPAPPAPAVAPAPAAVASPAAVPPSAAPAQAAADVAVTHGGRVYAVGYGPGYFGIWRVTGGSPIERYDRTDAGWRLAWARFQQLEGIAVPRWRRATGLWIFLNLLISLAVWFLVLLVGVLILAALGEDLDDVPDAAATGATIALPLSILGWMLFVYRKERRVRIAALVIGIVGSLVAVIAFGLSA